MMFTKIAGSSFFKCIAFFSVFFITRIPIWVVLIAAFYNEFITPNQCFYIILTVLICRGCIEAELVKGGVITFISLQFLRIFIKICLVFIIYFTFLYANFVAKPVDIILIGIFLTLIVILYFRTDDSKRSKFSIYFSGYRHNIFSGVLVFILWFYVSFFPDTLAGNVSAVTAIYIIEVMNLFKNYKLPHYLSE